MILIYDYKKVYITLRNKEVRIYYYKYLPIKGIKTINNEPEDYIDPFYFDDTYRSSLFYNDLCNLCTKFFNFETVVKTRNNIQQTITMQKRSV